MWQSFFTPFVFWWAPGLFLWFCLVTTLAACATPAREPRPVKPALLRQVAFLQFLFQETPSVLGHRVVSGACYRHFFLPSLARTCWQLGLKATWTYFGCSLCDAELSLFPWLGWHNVLSGESNLPWVSTCAAHYCPSSSIVASVQKWHPMLRWWEWACEIHPLLQLTFWALPLCFYLC